ncbi:S8 family serine peptidase [Actinoplanes sp. NPDC051861]|uniref:S8 family serine peptidase n=1 Tax=Actinoplanes sp. NPDC051861 TaxID=3155170 RepID=UPI003413CD73
MRRGFLLLRRLSAVSLVTVLCGAIAPTTALATPPPETSTPEKAPVVELATLGQAQAAGKAAVANAPVAEQAVRKPPANRDCADPGEPIGDVPWHQRALDPAKVATLSDGRGVVVGVIDSGVDSGHPQLAGKVRPGRDLLFPGGGPGDFDCIGHGTAVASIIAGGGEEGIPFRGYAPRVEIVPVVVSEKNAKDGEGEPGSASGFAQGIRFATDAGAQVINISLVLYEDVPAVRNAVQRAIDRGVVVVAAVGNVDAKSANAGRTPYPAAYPGVIGVGAVNEGAARPDSSPVGPWVDLVAPGDQVIAATRVRGYARYNGTSFAAPFVSAAAALILSREPGLTPDQVSRRLFATADPTFGGSPVRPWANGTGYGFGIVQPLRALVERPVAAEPREAKALSAYSPDETDPVRANQVRWALIIAVVVLAVAAAAGMGSIAMPRGRRRGWRPGRAPQPAPRTPAEGNRRLFDDLEDE